jgi:ABC-2 type transport system permease protein
MLKLWACIQKELTLLYRDFSGLMVLFVMPVVLVIVVTLVQENVLKSMGETRTEVLLIDQDRKTVGRQVEDSLRKSGSIEIIKEIKGKPIDVETAKKAVARGDFQVGIIIPPGITEAFRKTARQKVKNSISFEGEKGNPPLTAQEPSPELQVFFDPTLRNNFRAAVVGSLEKIILGIEVKERIDILFELLPGEIEGAAKKAAGPIWSDEFKKRIPKVKIDWDNTPLMMVKEKVARYGNEAIIPNTVQQNIPAWTLFGMFFIVVPLGGSIIRERQDGMLPRLLTMPTSYLTIISGKITAYVMICLVQFLLIITLGRFLLPFLGAPVLDLGSSPAALILIVVSSALAASGYGILLGTIARTYEQASMFGAVSVVIAAALGGIMVPVFVMPKIMQRISEFSPLSWALKAFLTVFVRNGDVWSILSGVVQLLIFFVSTTAIAWFFMSQRGRIRIQ